MDFKRLCDEFSKGKDVTTMLVHTQKKDIRGEDRVVYKWFFYLKTNGRKLPVSIMFDTSLNKALFYKNVYYRHEYPFPSMEVLLFVESFENYMKEHLEKDLHDRDTTRLKRVVDGSYKEKKVTHNFYGKKFEEEKKALKDLDKEKVNTLVEDFSHLLLTFDVREKGYSESVLFVYGNEGKALGEMLLEREICKVHFIDNDTTVIIPLFPFHSFGKDYFLSGLFLQYYETIELLTEAKVSFKICTEMNFTRYL